MRYCFTIWRYEHIGYPIYINTLHFDFIFKYIYIIYLCLKSMSNRA